MRTLLDKITPDEYVASVYAIDLDRLWQEGRRLLLTDLDNTLVPWNDGLVPSSLVTWYRQVVDHGFQLCIVSNNRGPRVQQFAEQLGAEAIGAAKKPKPFAFLRAMQMFQATPEQTVMVGDQLFTDVRGAKRCGIYTILVLPVARREWWGTRLTRVVERVALSVLTKRGLSRPTREGE
jgi:HAD superfamily phosphatase (TIGR01668 family)